MVLCISKIGLLVVAFKSLYSIMLSISMFMPALVVATSDVARRCSSVGLQSNVLISQSLLVGFISYRSSDAGIRSRDVLLVIQVVLILIVLFVQNCINPCITNRTLFLVGHWALVFEAPNARVVDMDSTIF